MLCETCCWRCVGCAYVGYSFDTAAPQEIALVGVTHRRRGGGEDDNEDNEEEDDNEEDEEVEFVPKSSDAREWWQL